MVEKSTGRDIFRSKRFDLLFFVANLKCHQIRFVLARKCCYFSTSERLIGAFHQHCSHFVRFDRRMTLSRNIAILGSTGSIGTSALKVIQSIDQFRVVALSGHRNLDLLVKQAQQFHPEFVVTANGEIARQYGVSRLQEQLPASTTLLMGPEALEHVATLDQVDTVLAAIVGIAGLESTLAAVKAGKRIALANKESLVVGGHLLTRWARDSGAQLLPVDSEHSAVFQALACGEPHEVQRVVLTASGGPFRDTPAEQLAHVTVEQALMHPTWEMGRKISIDSATMMNKALEIIEAKWLFQLNVRQLDVVIHPQSIVHSLVEYRDGSCIAQLSPPDMMLPIQYAFTYPERTPGPSPKLDLTKLMELSFFPPDRVRFPALDLGFDVVKLGGSCGAILNAANEAAVDAFLNQQLGFCDIATACREILEHHHFDPSPDLASIRAADQWARQEITKWINA